MRMITAIETLFFGPNVRLQMSEAMAKTRMHNLVPVEGMKNTYETKAEVCFKKGEEIGYGGTLTRAMAEKVLVEGKPVEGTAAAAAAKPKMPAAKPKAT